MVAYWCTFLRYIFRTGRFSVLLAWSRFLFWYQISADSTSGKKRNKVECERKRKRKTEERPWENRSYKDKIYIKKAKACLRNIISVAEVRWSLVFGPVLHLLQKKRERLCKIIFTFSDGWWSRSWILNWGPFQSCCVMGGTWDVPD